jgi:uncharacterized protein
MMWIERQVEPMLAERARTRPVVVLTGARQTGKTALVRRVFPRYTYVSLDLPSEAEQAELDPSGFLGRHPEPLVVDEVQYAPGLLRHLKRRIDERRGKNSRFILTGSQAFPLMAGVAESLAGRASVMTLGGLSHAEIVRARPQVSVEEVILRGGYPELHARPEIEARGFFQSYVATYLERDLRAQLQVGSLRDFERFLRAAALRTGQLLNRAELSRDVGVSPSTAGQWLSVLERSGIVALLEPWFSNRTKALVKTPKLHFQDTGLCGFLMGVDSAAALRESPLAGALWETMVFSELHRLAAAGTGSWQLAFWRDRTKEADFLLHKAGRFLLADAKWAEHPAGPGRLERIRAEFRRPPKAAIICRSPNPYPLGDGVTAQPLGGLSSWMAS